MSGNIHRPSENILVKACQTAATGTGNGIAIDSSTHELVLFVIHGTTSAASTIDAKLQESATSGGVYTDVPNAAIVQIPASTTSQVSTINVKASIRKRWLRVPVVIAGTASVDVLGELINNRQDPMTQDTVPVSV